MRYFLVNLAIALSMVAFTHAQATSMGDTITILPGATVRVNAPTRKTVRCMQGGQKSGLDPQAGEVVIRPGGAVVIEPNTPTTVRCRNL